MDSIKAKNFIILVLVIVNTVLLAVILTDSARGTELRREAVEGAVQLLSEYGISVSDDAQLGERSLSVYTVTRSEESERATAEALLGEVSMTDRGGGIMYYSSPLGEMTFRATGGVDLQYYGITAPKSDDPEKTALEMAKKLGVTVQNSEDSVSVSVKEDDSTVVEVCCSFMGAQVVNCRLSFTFKYGKLLSLSGTRPLSEVTSESMTNVIDVPTVLMRFIELTQEKGHVCSVLEQLELCFLQSSSASGGGSLSPVWRISTDTGDFYINAQTGKEESVS